MEEILAFIPFFEQGRFENSESVYISTGEYIPEIGEFLATLRRTDLPLTDFDWLPWADEAKLFMQNTDLIADADIDTLRRLLTVVRDADRFNGELLPFLCAKGVVHRILVRLRTLST